MENELRDFEKVNRANWESRVPLHLEGYQLDRFREDPEFLSGVVRFDTARLGDLAGLDVVHLQCHIGTDTVSLARLGARVTGLDFSPSALDAARELASDTGASIEFVLSSVFDAPSALGDKRFDVVYTGIGALCWLSDICAWARVVAALLRPGGRLYIREGHPVLWAMDDSRDDDLLVLRYPYFEIPGGTAFYDTSTYVASERVVSSPDTIQFNHGLGEIVSAVMAAGMTLTQLVEHDSVPWNPFADQMEQDEIGEWRLREGRERIPLTYTLEAVKAL
jgi:SAM-dependent methyltransferase